MASSTGDHKMPEQTKVLSEIFPEEIEWLENLPSHEWTARDFTCALATIRALQGQVQHLREIKSDEERVPQAVARLDEVLSISNAYPKDAGSWLVVREHILALQAENAAQAKQIEGLREALEFYADPRAKMISNGEAPEWIRLPDFWDEMDFGETARNALTGDTP